MTLAELCEKANISISYLSQIERDKTSPSLITLETIAKSLNIGLRYLFESEHEVAFVMRACRTDDALIASMSNVRQPLMPSSGNPEIEVYRITIQPQAAAEQIEQFSGEEIVFVLAGELTISIGDEQYILCTGDSLHYDALLMHSWENAADQPCIFIWGHARSLSDFQPASITRMWNKSAEENGV
jgi:transcriptional regulator with XRE-family HTH domain